MIFIQLAKAKGPQLIHQGPHRFTGCVAGAHVFIEATHWHIGFKHRLQLFQPSYGAESSRPPMVPIAT